MGIGNNATWVLTTMNNNNNYCKELGFSLAWGTHMNGLMET